MIIDTHVHMGLFESPEKVVDMSEEVVLKSMELYNIDFALVSNAAVEYDCLWKPVPPEKQVSQEFVDFHFDVELDEDRDYNEGWYKRMLCQKIGKVLVEQRFKDGDIDKQYKQLYAAMEELCPGENI